MLIKTMDYWLEAVSKYSRLLGELSILEGSHWEASDFNEYRKICNELDVQSKICTHAAKASYANEDEVMAVECFCIGLYNYANR